jgi:protein-L-isoaspartate(D-aspartate) O-methyltransferase
VNARVLAVLVVALTACKQRPAAPAVPHSVEADADFLAARADMVETQIAARRVADPSVLRAMRKVPRHRFVPPAQQASAYADRPLPIGHGQTISQPYVVAFMTEALGLRGGEKVLEVGTGSGYQAAVLGEIAGRVYSIEIVDALARSAAATLRELGYANVEVRSGDGYRGWPEQAPFDAIMVTAAPDHVPQPLVDQLREGGRMILPVGDAWQELVVLEKTAKGVTKRSVLPVRFVPMTGEAQRR